MSDQDKTDTKWQLRAIQTLAWVESNPAAAIGIACLGMMGTFLVGVFIGMSLG